MYLLIPAAGVGQRMQSEWQRQGKAHRNKLFLPLLNRPILYWTLLAVKQAQTIHWIGIIGQPQDFQDFKEIVVELGLSKMVHFVPGGATRQESVYRGLEALPVLAERVLIHDGARCLATPMLFDRCTEAVSNSPGFVAAVPVKDTIKVVKPNSDIIQHTPDRQHLWAAQTPQGFAVEPLLKCHRAALRHGIAVTDDAALFEQFELPVRVVMGEETNLKVTTPVDLAIAEFILAQRSSDNQSVAG